MLQCELIHGVRVRVAEGTVGSETGVSETGGIECKGSVKRRSVEEFFEEDAYVFEARVHTLPVKGDHGVRRIPNDHAGTAVVVRTALDVNERQVLVMEKLRLQCFGCDEVRGHAGEIMLEKLYYTGGIGFQLFEDGMRGEELTGERAILLVVSGSVIEKMIEIGVLPCSGKQ